MPRIWMTYIELSDLLGCTPMQARDHAISKSLVRRKSRSSGLTWTELDGELTSAFVARLHDSSVVSSPEIEMDQAIADLQDIHDEMTRFPNISGLRKRA